MLGLVFTECVELVEHQFSPETADAVLEQPPAHDGEPCSVSHAPHDGPRGAGVQFTLGKPAP